MLSSSFHQSNNEHRYLIEILMEFQRKLTENHQPPPVFSLPHQSLSLFSSLPRIFLFALIFPSFFLSLFCSPSFGSLFTFSPFSTLIFHWFFSNHSPYFLCVYTLIGVCAWIHSPLCISHQFSLLCECVCYYLCINVWIPLPPLLQWDIYMCVRYECFIVRSLFSAWYM